MKELTEAKRKAAKLEVAKRERDDAIRAAAAAGASTRQIGAAIGVVHSRIAAILKQEARS